MPHKKNSLNGQAELDLLDSICANTNLNEKTHKKVSKDTKSKKEKVVVVSDSSDSESDYSDSSSETETTSTSECTPVIERGPRGKRGKRGYPGYYLPNGVILLWYGDECSIPQGWAVCDGRIVNGRTTPNLRGRFVLGYAAVGATGPNYPLDFAATLGSTGGEQYHQLTLNELPAHNHGNTGNVNGSTAGSTGNYPSLFTGVSGAHNHNAFTGVTGQHTHTSNANGGNLGLAFINGAGTPGSIDTTSGEVNCKPYDSSQTGLPALSIDPAGNHAHSIAIDGSHDHSVTLRSVGQNVPHNTMPPYYVLIYIMKIY
jgi:microcystin-dependent protein